MADTPVTISRAKVSPLLNEERINGFTHKFLVDYTDVNKGAGTTDTVTMTLGTTPAVFVCTAAAVLVTTAFAGTGAFTVNVGFGANLSAAVAATSVATAGLIGTAGLVPANAAQSTATAAAAIKAVFTNATSGSPSALSAGQCVIYLKLLDISTKNSLG